MTDSAKLDLLLSEMQGMKNEMQGMKEDIHGLKDEMREVKEDVRGLKDEMREVKNEMQGMKEDIHGLKDEMREVKSDLKDVKQKVSKMNLILDNEIRVNIQRVAEGHLDLSRNLHDAMKPSSEVEMLAIKVRMLESEVRDIKSRFL